MLNALHLHRCLSPNGYLCAKQEKPWGEKIIGVAYPDSQGLLEVAAARYRGHRRSYITEGNEPVAGRVGRAVTGNDAAYGRRSPGNAGPGPHPAGIGYELFVIKKDAEIYDPAEQQEEHRQNNGEFDRGGPFFPLSVCNKPHGAIPLHRPSRHHRHARIVKRD